MAPPGPAAGGHGAGDEALHASSPPRQEHAWHRQGSSAGPAARSAAEQGARTSLGLGGGGDDGGHPSRKAPIPRLPWAHKPTPLGAGPLASPLSPCLVAQQGSGRGCHPPPPPLPRGAACFGGHRSPGMLGARRVGGVPPGQGGLHRPAAPSALGGSKARGLPAWWGKVLQRCPRTPTAAVPLCQASHPLPPHHTPSPLPVSHQWHQCRVVLGSTWQAVRAVLHGPRSPFFPLTPLGPVAVVRDGQRRTPAWAGRICAWHGGRRQHQVSPCCPMGADPIQPFSPPQAGWAQSGLLGLPYPFSQGANEIPGREHTPHSPAGPFAQPPAPR